MNSHATPFVMCRSISRMPRLLRDDLQRNLDALGAISEHRSGVSVHRSYRSVKSRDGPTRCSPAWVSSIRAASCQHAIRCTAGRVLAPPATYRWHPRNPSNTRPRAWAWKCRSVLAPTFVACPLARFDGVSIIARSRARRSSGYFHPYDTDAAQERVMSRGVGGSRVLNALLYFNRARTLTRLESMLDDGFRIVPYCEFVRSLPHA